MKFICKARAGYPHWDAPVRFCFPNWLLFPCIHSQTHKVANNGINANFVFTYACIFLHYLDLNMLVNVKLDCRLVKGITLFHLLNFKWYSYNKVGNIDILVL